MIEYLFEVFNLQLRWVEAGKGFSRFTANCDIKSKNHKKTVNDVECCQESRSTLPYTQQTEFLHSPPPPHLLLHRHSYSHRSLWSPPLEDSKRLPIFRRRSHSKVLSTQLSSLFIIIIFSNYKTISIFRCEELVSYISTKPPASELMRAMDDISDTVISLLLYLLLLLLALLGVLVLFYS